MWCHAPEVAHLFCLFYLPFRRGAFVLQKEGRWIDAKRERGNSVQSPIAVRERERKTIFSINEWRTIKRWGYWGMGFFFFFPCDINALTRSLWHKAFALRWVRIPHLACCAASVMGLLTPCHVSCGDSCPILEYNWRYKIVEPGTY